MPTGTGIGDRAYEGGFTSNETHGREWGYGHEDKMDDIQEELKEKEEELDDLEALNQALVVKERKSNDELQEARKELISYFKGRSGRAFIAVSKWEIWTLNHFRKQ
ncbi:hypothetical protein CK203_007403 [Vitis vinifera]|uniref:Uncharacterized protein n=1 Tax=Vitis vinifera TaxID=29760 RepID=A0A438G1S2_VITVI|nr:hypothetical protein CK203_007403 [Vitis vinifera]